MRIKMKEAVKLNIQVFKELAKYDRMRPWITSIFCFFDTLELVIYNIAFLPVIYYAVQVQFPPAKYLIVTLCMFILLMGNSIFSSYYNIYYKDNSNENVRYNFQRTLFTKIREIDVTYLERQEFYEKVNMLFKIGDVKMLEAFDMIWWAISSMVLVFAYLAVIISLEPVFILIAAIGAAFTYRVNNQLYQKEYCYNIEEMRIKRIFDYVHRVFSLSIYADDMRTSGIASVINKKYVDAVMNLRELIRSYTYKIIKLKYFKNLILFLITTTVTSIYLGFQYLVKNTIDLTVSEIVIVQTNLYQLCYVLTNIFGLVPQFKKNALYLKIYYEFMDYEPKIKKNEKGLEAQKGSANSLDIRNVSFAYEEDRKILKNINLSIKSGEKIAIVGHNGAGKSTFIKLLLQLYLPQEGRIELDGILAEEYRLQSYRDRFGVAFQDSVMYAVNVAENVMMRPVDLSKEAKKVWKALERCGMKEQIEYSTNGIGTMMTKEFDDRGIELSGGQAHKIALARIFARDSGIIILDEPSSALDPVSEYEMYKNMLDLSVSRTFIIISHRLSICKDMDRIILLKDGEILECGSHKELLKKNGKYAEMWNIQAEQFC